MCLHITSSMWDALSAAQKLQLAAPKTDADWDFMLEMNRKAWDKPVLGRDYDHVYAEADRIAVAAKV